MMALTVADLLVRLRADTTQFKSAMSNASKNMKTIGAGMTEFGGKATASMTIPLLGVGIAAGKMSADFEMSIAKMKGLVGVADKDLTLFKDAIKKVGKETGKTGTELAEAAFYITSAGLKGERAAEGVEALRAAAQGAAAGLGETAAVADAATSAMNSYGAGAMSATRAVAILVSTVREGKADAASIAPVLGRLLPVAAELEVSFDQVGGALAAMTRLGFDAATSATSIRATLVAMLKPSVQAKKALAEYGMSFADLRQELKEKGLISVLQKLKGTFGDNEEAMARVFPNVRALAGILSLVGENAEASRVVFENLANTTERDLSDALKAVTDTSAYGFQQAMVDMRGVLRELGDVILPAVVPAFRGLADVIGVLGDAFSFLPGPLKSTVVYLGLAAATMGPLAYLGGNLVSMFGILTGVLAKMNIQAALANVSLSKTIVSLKNPAGLGGAGLVSGFSALSVAITAVVSYKLTDWFMKNTEWGKKLSKTVEDLGFKMIDFYDGMKNGRKDFDKDLYAYQQLAKRLKLTGEQWRITADYTAANKDRLKELTAAAMKYAVEQNKVNIATAQSNIEKGKEVNLAQKRIDQISGEAKAQSELSKTLKEQYELYSGDDIRRNMDMMSKHFEKMKADGIDMKQLAGAFGDDLLNWVELAKQNSIELPLGVRKMAEEMKTSGTPEMNKLLDAVSEDFPRHVNAMPGKLLPAYAKIRESVGGSLSGGWGDGVEAIKTGQESDILKAALKTQVGEGIKLGVEEGEVELTSLRQRQQAEVLTVKVVGDWSDFDKQARWRSSGYVPETGAP